MSSSVFSFPDMDGFTAPFLQNIPSLPHMDHAPLSNSSIQFLRCRFGCRHQLTGMLLLIRTTSAPWEIPIRDSSPGWWRWSWVEKGCCHGSTRWDPEGCRTPNKAGIKWENSQPLGNCGLRVIQGSFDPSAIQVSITFTHTEKWTLDKTRQKVLAFSRLRHVCYWSCTNAYM